MKQTLTFVAMPMLHEESTSAKSVLCSNLIGKKPRKILECRCFRWCDMKCLCFNCVRSLNMYDSPFNFNFSLTIRYRYDTNITHLFKRFQMTWYYDGFTKICFDVENSIIFFYYLFNFFKSKKKNLRLNTNLKWTRFLNKHDTWWLVDRKKITWNTIVWSISFSGSSPFIFLNLI